MRGADEAPRCIPCGVTRVVSGACACCHGRAFAEPRSQSLAVIEHVAHDRTPMRFLALLVLAAPLAAHTGRLVILQPQSYASNDGAWSLHVDPSDQLGRGAARYELTHAGRHAWTGEFPWTLWRAVVDDHGNFAGFVNEDPSKVRSGNAMHLVVVRPDGSVAYSHWEERRRAGSVFGVYTPSCGEIVHDPRLDAFVFRVERKKGDWEKTLEWFVCPRDGSDASVRSGESPLTEAGRENAARIVQSSLTRPWPDAPTETISAREVEMIDLQLPDEVPMPSVRFATVDLFGRYLVQSSADQSITVFAPNGEASFVCRLDRADVDERARRSDVSAAPDGGVLVATRGDEWLRFDATGSLVQRCEVRVGAPVPLVPSGEIAGRRSYDRLVFLDERLATTCERTRRPDGLWFGNSPILASRLDGTLAVVDRAMDRLEGLPSTMFVGRSLDEARAYPLPREVGGKLSLGRTRALRSSTTATHVLDLDDGEIRRVEIDAAPGLDVLGFHADGEDVVALDAAALIVVRFRLE